MFYGEVDEGGGFAPSALIWFGILAGLYGWFNSYLNSTNRNFDLTSIFSP